MSTPYEHTSSYCFFDDFMNLSKLTFFVLVVATGDEAKESFDNECVGPFYHIAALSDLLSDYAFYSISQQVFKDRTTKLSPDLSYLHLKTAVSNLLFF